MDSGHIRVVQWGCASGLHSSHREGSSCAPIPAHWLDEHPKFGTQTVPTSCWSAQCNWPCRHSVQGKRPQQRIRMWPRKDCRSNSASSIRHSLPNSLRSRLCCRSPLASSLGTEHRCPCCFCKHGWVCCRRRICKRRASNCKKLWHSLPLRSLKNQGFTVANRPI